MRKSLIVLATALLPFTAFAADYKCEFLENEAGATGFAEAKENQDGEYTLRLSITVDGETDDGTSDTAVRAEEGNSEMEIGMFYTYYDAAHGGNAPVAMADVKSVKGMRYEENDGEFEVSYLIFRDADEKVLDQTVLLNGHPLACKR